MSPVTAMTLQDIERLGHDEHVVRTIFVFSSPEFSAGGKLLRA
jgi:hypothetical protein